MRLNVVSISAVLEEGALTANDSALQINTERFMFFGWFNAEQPGGGLGKGF